MSKPALTPKLEVIWEPGEQPDESDLLLIFDMLFPLKTADLTKPTDELLFNQPQDQ